MIVTGVVLPVDHLTPPGPLFIEAAFPMQALVGAPYLMMGKTDSGLYANQDSQVLRFMPFPVNRTNGDLLRIHGINERLSQESYLKGVQFYLRFLQLAL